MAFSIEDSREHQRASARVGLRRGLEENFLQKDLGVTTKNGPGLLFQRIVGLEALEESVGFDYLAGDAGV